jgi:hypothetical protein
MDGGNATGSDQYHQLRQKFGQPPLRQPPLRQPPPTPQPTFRHPRPRPHRPPPQLPHQAFWMFGSPGINPACSAMASETARRIAPRRSATSRPAAPFRSEGVTDFGGTAASAAEVPRAPSDNSPTITRSVRCVIAMSTFQQVRKPRPKPSMYSINSNRRASA